MDTVAYLVLLFCCICSPFISFDLLAIFQQCGYVAGEFSDWLYKKGWKRRTKIAFLSLFSSVFYMVTETSGANESISFVVIGVAYIFSAFLSALKPKLKVKPVFTMRFLRTIVVTIAVSVVFASFLFFFIGFKSVVLCCLTAEYISLSGIILYPYEKIKRMGYEKKARKKLASMKGLIKIGITGSSGKTSVKNYLAVILEGKYRVYKTPKSFNTPLGICRSVEEMPTDSEIFVAEMGARKKGDIKELCSIVDPTVGVITTITEQHIKTFGSMERLKDTKFELIEGLNGGFAVFSADDEGSVELMNRCAGEKFSAGFNGGLVKVVDYICKNGKSKIVFRVNDREFEVETTLIGRHNALDLSLAFAVALKLGMTEEEIVERIKGIVPVEHRLELLKTENGITVIDDGYNANPLGMKSAAEALDCFDGRKFAVVSGIVEGGKEDGRLNKEAGKIFGEVADFLIAVGENAQNIADGGKDKKAEIFKAKDLEDAKGILYSLIKKGDTVIFVNDLPDKY
ncbi:MAG: UDP-N-acetylmuramoyl-tripeptide--D-alanyl-D-alanine ligase [Clostridia bacterium]|nr:UDP-N-acetylmuramoyl-tripeptide--D-alanyl-D-alanine ligase [Clostridia bacterium]